MQQLEPCSIKNQPRKYYRTPGATYPNLKACNFNETAQVKVKLDLRVAFGWKEVGVRWESASSPRQPVANRLISFQEALGWMLGNISPLKGWSGIGVGWPGQWWNHHPWKHSNDVWMWRLGTRLSGEYDSFRLTAGIKSLGKSFWTQTLPWFCD